MDAPPPYSPTTTVTPPAVVYHTVPTQVHYPLNNGTQTVVYINPSAPGQYVHNPLVQQTVTTTPFITPTVQRRRPFFTAPYGYRGNQTSKIIAFCLLGSFGVLCVVLFLIMIF